MRSPYAHARLLGEHAFLFQHRTHRTSSFPRKRESRSLAGQFLPRGGPGCSSRCRGALPRRWPDAASRDGLAQRYGWTPAFSGVTYARVLWGDCCVVALRTCPASGRATSLHVALGLRNVVTPAKAGIQIYWSTVSTVRLAGLLVSDTGAHFHDVGRPPPHETALRYVLAALSHSLGRLTRNPPKAWLQSRLTSRRPLAQSAFNRVPKLDDINATQPQFRTHAPGGAPRNRS